MLQSIYELPHDKTNKMTCASRKKLEPAWASAQSDQSSLSTCRHLGSLATDRVHSEGSDQTGWMPRLIWAFIGPTGHIVGFIMLRLIYIFKDLSCYSVIKQRPSKNSNSNLTWPKYFFFCITETCLMQRLCHVGPSWPKESKMSW